MLFTKFEFPKSTRIRIADPPLIDSTETKADTQYESDSLYKVRVESAPGLTKEHAELAKKQEYLIKGKDLSSIAKGKSEAGTYELKSPTLLYQATRAQIQTPDPETAAKVCLDCEASKHSEKTDAHDLSTKLLLQTQRDWLLKSGQVPERAFRKAWDYFAQNYHRIRNKDYMTVVDYSKPSDEPRLFLINLKTGSVEKHLVSHGINSSGTGSQSKYAVKYSNTPESKTSSYGPFLTGEDYVGRFGYSLRIDGQSPGINSNARKRAIVIHPWNTQAPPNGGRPQETWGCFGLDPTVSEDVIGKMRNGGLWYVEPYQS